MRKGAATAVADRARRALAVGRRHPVGGGHSLSISYANAAVCLPSLIGTYRRAARGAPPTPLPVYKCVRLGLCLVDSLGAELTLVRLIGGVTCLSALQSCSSCCALPEAAAPAAAAECASESLQFAAPLKCCLLSKSGPYKRRRRTFVLNKSCH